jgi:hypothetical protein
MQRGYKKFLIGKDGKEKFEIYNAIDVKDVVKSDTFSAEKNFNGDVMVGVTDMNGKHFKFTLDKPTFKKFVKFLNEFESCIS